MEIKYLKEHLTILVAGNDLIITPKPYNLTNITLNCVYKECVENIALGHRDLKVMFKMIAVNKFEFQIYDANS